MSVLVPSPALRPAQVSLEALPPLALYVHIPVVRAQVPVLRLQFARGARRAARSSATLTRVDRRPRAGAAAGLGAARAQRLLRRRHAQPAVRARARRASCPAVRARLPLSPDAEITLEANPGTFEAQKFADFRALGVNRLSIGIQSFDPQHLQALGRIHDEREARRAVEIAHANFDNFNLDLMYALPEQTLEQAEADIAAAIALGADAPVGLSPDHRAQHLFPPLSARKCPTTSCPPTMQEAIEALLAQGGYAHYETSAFARPGTSAGTTSTTGVSATTSASARARTARSACRDRIVRQMRYKHPREYMEQALPGEPVQQEHDVAPPTCPSSS